MTVQVHHVTCNMFFEERIVSKIQTSAKHFNGHTVHCALVCDNPGQLLFDLLGKEQLFVPEMHVLDINVFNNFYEPIEMTFLVQSATKLFVERVTIGNFKTFSNYRNSLPDPACMYLTHVKHTPCPRVI